MRVKIDHGLCNGCGLCVRSCPSVFAVEVPDTLPFSKVDEVPEEDEPGVWTAISDCPTGAISVRNWRWYDVLVVFAILAIIAGVLILKMHRGQ